MIGKITGVIDYTGEDHVLIETGGMPSSHSALVTGTAACMGWTLGFDHPLFALAAMVAFVVSR